MAVVKSPAEKLSEAFKFIEDLPSNASREFLLAHESQTTESILAEDSHTVYRFEKFAGENEDVLDLMHQRSKEIISDQVQAVIENENKGLTEYDISNRKKDDSLLEYVYTDNIENFERFEGILDTQAIIESEYDPEDQPAFQTFRIVDDGEVIFAGMQKYTQRQVLSDDDGVKLAFGRDSGQYNSFTGTVVSFLSRIDCFYFDGSIFILNPTRFEDIFDYLHEYKEDANDVLTAVRDSDINIADFDKFVDSVRNDRRALRKMREIKEIGVYKDMNREEVEQIVDDFNLSIHIESGGEDMDWALAIPDMRKKWDIIRLLNDDHLYSDLSKDRYQVYGKDNRS
jgi:hypothetical protein